MKNPKTSAHLERQVLTALLLSLTLVAPSVSAADRKGVRSTSRGGNSNVNLNQNRNVNVNQNVNRNVNVNQNVNRNVNINQNVNVNRRVDVDVDVHHSGRYYDDNHGHFWGGFAAGLVIGSIIATPPPHPQTIVIQNTSYIVSDGVYYQTQGSGYVVVNPPIGVTVQVVPPGATQVVINGQVYFLANGVHYQPVMQNGVTVYTTVKI